MSIYIGSRYETGTVLPVTWTRTTARNTVFRGKSQFFTSSVSGYVVVQGDRLDQLAERFYGDPTLWWVIADANSNLALPDPLVPGTMLRIPRGQDIR